MEILQNLFRVPSVTANTYLLVDPDGLTLIDTGLPRRASKILSFIDSLGYAAGDLKHILLTHADSDHVGSLADLQAVSEARTYSSPIEAEAIRAGRFSRPLQLHGWKKWLFDISMQFFKVSPSRVDQELFDNQILPIWGGLQVIETPGHTPGHLSFYAPQKKVLFCGDSLRCPQGEIIISRGANTWNADVARSSAIKQAALGARIVCAGHGAVVQDAGHSFDALIRYLEEEREGS